MKKTILLYLTILPTLLWAQTDMAQQVRIDSLKQVIEQATSDTVVVNSLHLLSLEYYPDVPDTVLYYQQQILINCDRAIHNKEVNLTDELEKFYQLAKVEAQNYFKLYYQIIKPNQDSSMHYLKLSQKIYMTYGDTAGLARIEFGLGRHYMNSIQYQKAIPHFKNGIKLSKEPFVKSRCYLDLAFSYKQLGDNKNYLVSQRKAYAFAEEFNITETMSSLLIDLADFYTQQGNYDLALINYNKASAICEKNNDAYDLARCYGGIADIYSAQQRYDLAIKTVKQGHQIFASINTPDMTSTYILAIAEIFLAAEQYDSASYYINQYVSFNQEQELISGFEVGLLGDIAFANNQLDSALTYYLNDKALVTQKELKASQPVVNNKIGKVYFQQKKTNLATRSFLEAFNIAEELELKEEIKISAEYLSQIYADKNNFQLSLNYYQEYISARDSINANLNKKALLREELKYEYEEQALLDSLRYEEGQKLAASELTSQKLRNNYLIAGLLLTILFGGFAFNRFKVTQKQKEIIEDQKSLVEQEKEKSENLLLNILPQETVQELREHGKVKAKYYPAASVLFTDFIGFTSITEQLPPDELVAALNHCFSAFDQIMEKYGIEKIKTIGDAYMATCGVPISNANHAKITVQAALEINAFITKYSAAQQQKGRPSFDLRIGVHSGPLIAGVVGTNKFQYDVWGDTVNIASRVENSGQKGKVNISEATYQLLNDHPDFQFESRGQVEVKGKGAMVMFFVS